MTATDLIIIGAGPGGYRAAEYAAKNGLKVIVFENDEVGGTCLNRGCIPTKSFARNAEIVQTLKDAETFGIGGLQYQLDFKRVVERKNQVLDSLRSGINTLLSQPGITLIREKASFVNASTVATPSGEQYTAKNIIVATGSVSKMLKLEEWDESITCDSSDLLADDTLPESLCIVGAGVIGMEFASIFNAFGVDVTVVEFLKECLPALDSDIAKRLRKYLEKQGINFKMKTAVEDIADIDADVILMATGRKPRTEGLGLETLGIMFEKNGAIPVDDNFHVISGSLTDGQSVVPQSDADIYAIGDANGLQMLAHAAEMQAIRAMNHIIGKKDNIRFDIMPAAIFTEPEAACVGPTEDQLKAASVASGLPADYTCHKAFWRANGKALTMNETEGMLKLFSAADGRILGCHAYGAHSADIVQEVSVLMCRDTTIQQLRDMVHIHPTLGEILRGAVE